MSPFPTSKGHLINPRDSVRITRLPPGEDVADLVRHYWIPLWDLPAGRTERQIVLGYPACNLVVEPHAVTLAGPTTRASHRDLSDSGWAVGALLRPAAGPALLSAGITGEPVSVADLVDREVTVDTGDIGDLRDAVTVAMSRGDVADAVAAVEDFLRGLRRAVTDDGLLANRMQDVVEGLPVRTVDEVARALAVSPRTLQRLARTCIGLSPSTMIRRRRLQDAADVVRREPGADLATVAAEHGYADHAHLTREFRDVLGFTPSQYRTESGG